jgi:hypothetical protein
MEAKLDGDLVAALRAVDGHGSCCGGHQTLNACTVSSALSTL